MKYNLAKKIIISRLVLVGIIFFTFPIAKVSADEADIFGFLSLSGTDSASISQQLQDIRRQIRDQERIRQELFNLNLESGQARKQKQDVDYQLKELRDLRNLQQSREQLKNEEQRLKLNQYDNLASQLKRKVDLNEKEIKTIEEIARLTAKIDSQEKTLKKLYSPDVPALDPSVVSSSEIISSTTQAIEIERISVIAKNRNDIVAKANKLYPFLISSSSEIDLSSGLADHYQSLAIRGGDPGWQFDFLCFLLERGLNSSGDLEFSKLSEVDFDQAGFVIISQPDRTLKEGGIGGIIVNPGFYGAIDRLSAAYPEHSFIKTSEIKTKLEASF